MGAACRCCVGCVLLQPWPLIAMSERIAFVIDNPAGKKARPPHLTKEEPVMKSRGMRTIAIVTALVSALGGRARAAQDKYTVKVPGGLAFSEFRGYESWNVVSISQDGALLAAILTKPVMIDA